MDSSTTTSCIKPTLLTLPQELQDKIFDLAYPSQLDVKYISAEDWEKREEDRWRESRRKHIMRPFPPPMVNELLVSKAYFVAAACSLFAEQHFHQGSPYCCGNQNTPTGIVAAFARSLRIADNELCWLDSFRGLRRLTVEVHEDWLGYFIRGQVILSEDRLGEEHFKVGFEVLPNLSGLRGLQMFHMEPVVPIEGVSEVWKDNVERFGAYVRERVTQPMARKEHNPARGRFSPLYYGSRVRFGTNELALEHHMYGYGGHVSSEGPEGLGTIRGGSINASSTLAWLANLGSPLTDADVPDTREGLQDLLACRPQSFLTWLLKAKKKFRDSRSTTSVGEISWEEDLAPTASASTAPLELASEDLADHGLQLSPLQVRPDDLNTLDALRCDDKTGSVAELLSHEVREGLLQEMQDDLVHPARVDESLKSEHSATGAWEWKAKPQVSSDEDEKVALVYEWQWVLSSDVSHNERTAERDEQAVSPSSPRTTPRLLSDDRDESRLLHEWQQHLGDKLPCSEEVPPSEVGGGVKPPTRSDFVRDRKSYQRRKKATASREYNAEGGRLKLRSLFDMPSQLHRRKEAAEVQCEEMPGWLLELDRQLTDDDVPGTLKDMQALLEWRGPRLMDWVDAVKRRSPRGSDAGRSAEKSGRSILQRIDNTASSWLGGLRYGVRNGILGVICTLAVLSLLLWLGCMEVVIVAADDV